MKEVFVNGLGIVNAQFIDELSTDFFPLTEDISKAKSPSLKEMISPVMSRRIAAGVKMGIYASKKAIDDAQIEQIDGIITGTALGCLVDSEKFLTNIIQNKEEFLTPTAFIQSTHNTVGSQIALTLKCNAYNFTYSNGYNSFENALLDGLKQIENEESSSLLVGGIDEIGKRTYELQALINENKSKKNQKIKRSEGAHFFILSNEKTENSYANLKDVFIQNRYDEINLLSEIKEFIKTNGLKLSDVNAIFSGEETLFENKELKSSTALFSYKNFIGEYGTSSAFALSLGCLLLKNQSLPTPFKVNDFESSSYKNIVLINGVQGKDLSLVLLQSV